MIDKSLDIVMIPMKKNNGVITFHTSFPVSSLKLQECTTDVKDNMDTRRSVLLSSTKLRSSSECVSSDITDKQSPSGPKLRPKQECLPHTTHRELQAKMEAENRQWRKTIKPLLDTENALLKELETFLSQRDTTQLRRKELLHKHWTERVWFPLQSRVEDGVSTCSLVEAKRFQSLYSQFLHHCNTKVTASPISTGLGPARHSWGGEWAVRGLVSFPETLHHIAKASSLL
ncbi:protein FAM228A isoform X1 [Channa argus]|uniref:protein FAM228A isoform X1 n=2 Tax=Channa argus TaxID=215402 RepID=UPI0035222906